MNKNGAPDVISIFAEPQTREHVARMYEIGIQQQQESGFAVYEGNVVSKLVVPDVHGRGEDFMDALDSACGVDLTPVKTSKSTRSSRENLTHMIVDLFDSNDYSALDTLEAQTAAKVRGVMADYDIDRDKKTLIIEKLLKRAQQDPVDAPRTDIVMVAHNHPQLAMFPTHTRDLMLPSAADLEIHTAARAHSPSMVDLIVAPALRGSHKGLLFASPDTTTANPERYDLATERVRKTDQSLGELSLAGYVYAEVDLTKTGRIAQSGIAKVRAFESELNKRAALTVR